MAFFTQAGLIGPVLALILWTFVMWVWMFATRIPAMQKMKVDYAEAARAGRVELPYNVRRIGDNYNHLHEQPTLFYALALATEILGAGDPINLALAWIYVGLRVAHSIFQATVNVIPIRFVLFCASSAALLVLLVRAILAAAAPGDV